MSRQQSSGSFPGDKSPAVVRYPRSEPACVTRLVSEHDQPHIRSPFATAAPTSRLCGGQGSGRREPFSKTAGFTRAYGGLLPVPSTWIHQDRSRPEDCGGLDAWKTGLSSGRPNHGPSITTPALTYFQQSATSSFRASATIVVFAPTTAVTIDLAQLVLEPDVEGEVPSPADGGVSKARRAGSSLSGVVAGCPIARCPARED